MIAKIDVMIEDIWLREPVPAFSLGNQYVRILL